MKSSGMAEMSSNNSLNKPSITIIRPVLFILCGLSALALSLTGCLDTRTAAKEQEEKQVIKKQLTTLQQTNADVNTRFQDVDDELRKVNGRVEALENKQNQASSKTDKADKLVEGKLKDSDAAYREEFTKLHSEIAELKNQLASAQDEMKRSAATEHASAIKNPFQAAEDKFEKKSWQEAILDYNRYIKASPKGKNVVQANYKIGICFQELGMNDDARAFFEGVIARYPKSKEAEKAKARLKSLKKK
jgi:TolA-binding protein